MPPDTADNWDAQLQAVRAAERAGHWTEARALAEAMWTDGRQAGPMEVVLDAAVVAARVRANADDLAGASEWLNEVLAEPRTVETTAARADAWVVLAGVRASLGDGAAAAQAIQRSVELLANGSFDVEHRQRAYNGLSVAYYQLGLCLHAARMARESVRILPPEPGDGAGMLRRLNLAMVLTVMHDQSSSLPDGLDGEDWLGLALEQLQVVEAQVLAMAPWLRMFQRVLQAGVWRRQGRVDEAIACLREVQGADVAAPDTLRRYARQELAQSLALQGATRDEARALAEALLREAREAPGAATSMWQLENIAQLAEVAGRMDEAYQALSRSMALLRRNVVALLDTPAEGLSGIVDAQALRLFNVDLEERNRVLARTVQDISHAAQFDALTGVLNRRGLEVEFGRVRGRGEFALAMLDVDHFKAINDGYSHTVGDAVLRRLGATLQEQLRLPDVVGRWGGEEFLLLLDGAGAARARSIAERLRLHIESAAWHELAEGLAVTVSIGVAVARPDEAFADIVRRADHELYKAKRAGRNRVCPD